MIAAIVWMVLGGFLTVIGFFAWGFWMADINPITFFRDLSGGIGANVKSCAQCGKRFDINGAENWIFCVQCLKTYCGDHRDHAGHAKPMAGNGGKG